MKISKVKQSKSILRLLGFTLVEMVIVIAVFILITTAIIGTYVKIFQLIEANKVRITALDLANEQIEIIHNLPYSDVGEIGGIPNGKIPQTQTLTRDNLIFIATTTIRNIDDPFDGQIGSSTHNDLSPADYKLVQIDITPQKQQFSQTLSLVTYIAPKSLEGASTNGALFIKVFDANGIPIAGANVHIQNNSLTPNVSIDDVTDSNGLLQIVDAPPSSSYNISVTKSGYSAEQTYPIGGAGNPNPTKPNATVVIQQVTQVSFSIDHLSTLSFQTVNAQCQPITNVGFNLHGAKLIGTPNLYKYNSTLNTGGSGTYSNSSFEWDSYSLALTGSTYDLVGTNPILPLNVLPNSTQAVQLVLAPTSPRTLLVNVTDSSTGLPLSDATVTLSGSGFSQTLTTGKGFSKQTDWSGGSGQTDFVNATQYYSDDGNVDVTSAPGELKLSQVFGSYRSNGILTSSIFDLGTTTNFKQILWNPTDQPITSGPTSAKFQISSSQTNTSTTTWNFVGPDGTGATYFTTSNQDISLSSAARYIRYQAYLSTLDNTVTPNVSDILITYTSSCIPPGQVSFTSLTGGNYSITVSKSGYQDYTASINIGNNYQSTNIILSP